MRFWAQLAAIVLAGVAIGVTANALSARPVHLLRPVYPASSSGVAVCGDSPEGRHEGHGHQVMPTEEAVAACNACSVAFVDARGAAAFAQGHIPGAFHLPPAGHPGESKVLEQLRHYPAVVAYDSGGNCGLAEGVADRLTAAGFKDVRLLGISFDEWMDAGGPALSGACQACGPSEGHTHGGAP